MVKSYCKILITAILFGMMSVCNTNAKVRQTSIYMFGVAASFTDSVAYISDIQSVDSVPIDAKTKFLMDRNLYSVQLHQHISETKGISNITTAVYYNLKKAKLAKKYARVRQKLEKEKGVRLSTINFNIHSEQWIEPTIVTPDTNKKKKKK